MNSRWKLDILVAMVSRSQTCMNKLRVLSRFHALSPLQPFGFWSLDHVIKYITHLYFRKSSQKIFAPDSPDSYCAGSAAGVPVFMEI